MSATYFKPNSLDIHILIRFKKGKSSKNGLILEEIKLFWKESEVVAYIEENSLKNLNKKPLKDQGVVSDLIDLINDYFSRKKINLYDSIKNINLDLDLKEKFRTEFSQKVMNIVSQLKHGEVTSYSDIGHELNSKAYRAIGSVLKKNPIPLIIPCHRVLGKNGIGGFMGKINNGEELNLKRSLLEIEGVFQ
jgi:methylated-DNA-[protein]-cysteine S-methyltransferase